MTSWQSQLLSVQEAQTSRIQVRNAMWYVVDHMEDFEEEKVLEQVADLLLAGKIPHAASVVGVLYSAHLALPTRTHPWLLVQLEGPDASLAMAAAQMLSICGGCVPLAEYLSTKTSPHQDVLEVLWETFIQPKCARQHDLK